jgi:multidrug efflux pump subunit AcrA (membrane-fusion protein)
MFRLVLFLFSFMFSSLWRPDPPADDPPKDDPPKADPPKDDPPAGRFTQEDVDRIVSERLDRERRKTERESEEAQRKAREDALKEQGKYKEIAEQHASTIAERDGRIQELEAAETERDDYKQKFEDLEKRYAKLIEDRLSVVPEPFRPLLEQMSVTERADWLEKNAEKLGTVSGERKPNGSRPSPRPANDDRKDASVREQAERQQRQATRSAF